MARKQVTVKLKMSELIYDVHDKTYLTGRSRRNGDNYEQVANMQSNDDEENLNQLIRSISNSYSFLLTELSEFRQDIAVTEENNELLDADAGLTIMLDMPSNYNESTPMTVSQNCHQYIVNRTVADWFLITNKADSADYISLAGENINNIRNAVNRRVRPQRT